MASSSPASLAAATQAAIDRRLQRIEQEITGITTRRSWVVTHDPSIIDADAMRASSPLHAGVKRKQSERQPSVRHAPSDKVALPTAGTLLSVLQTQLPHIDQSSWPARFELGGIFVNGRPPRCLNDRLELPCQIEYFEPKVALDRLSSMYPAFHPEHIVFLDADLIVAFKPAGLPSKPPKEQNRFSLFSYLLHHLQAARAPSTSQPSGTEAGADIHMPSRLDWGTAGLVVVSRLCRMHRPLQALFETKAMQKFYLFESPVPVGLPESVEKQDGQHRTASGDTNGTSENKIPRVTHDIPCTAIPWRNGACLIDNAIDENPLHSVLRRTTGAAGSGQRAQTILRRVAFSQFKCEDESMQPSIVVCAQPLTGRTHQIRLHAASVGLPIINDNFYEGALSFRSAVSLGSGSSAAAMGGFTPDTISCEPVPGGSSGSDVMQTNGKGPASVSSTNSLEKAIQPDDSHLHLLSFRVRFVHPFTQQLLDVSVPRSLLPAWAADRRVWEAAIQASNAAPAPEVGSFSSSATSAQPTSEKEC